MHMKKLLLLCMAIGTFACTNQIIESIPNSVSTSGDTLLCLDGVIWNETYDMLVFEDSAAFWNIYTCLEKADSAWFSYQLEQNYTSENEQDSFLNDLENGLDKVLYSFENNFGYTSLRSQINLDMQEFTPDSNYRENNETLPDDNFIQGRIMQTLFNSEGEVKIGEIIYKIKNVYDVYVIYDESVETLNQIRSGEMNYENLSSYVDYHDASPGIKIDPCKSNKCTSTIQSNYFTYDGKSTYYTLTKTCVVNLPYINNINGVVTAFYYKNNNRKNGKVWMYLGSGGTFRKVGTDCDSTLCFPGVGCTKFSIKSKDDQFQIIRVCSSAPYQAFRIKSNDAYSVSMAVGINQNVITVAAQW